MVPVVILLGFPPNERRRLRIPSPERWAFWG